MKHSELPIFMKIAASLQIKGLTAHEDGQRYAASVASPTLLGPPSTAAGAASTKDPSPPSVAQTTSKRSQDLLHETYPIMPKRRSNQAHNSQRMMAELLHQVQTQQQNLRSNAAASEFMSSESTEGNHGHGHGHSGNNIAEDVLMPAITLSESSSRFSLSSVKREEEAVDNNSVTVASHNNNNNGSERSLFASPLKIEFGGGPASDLEAVTTAAAMSYHMNRQGLPSPQAYKFDLNLTGNSSNDEFNKSSMNHMVIPTGERKG